MKKCRKYLALVFIMILAARCMIFPSYSEAATASEIQQQINDAEKEKEELENKQEQTENELGGLKQEKNTLQGKLYELNTTLEEVG